MAVRALQVVVRQERVVVWRSAPIALERGRHETFEAAAERALSGAHLHLRGRFRQRKDGQARRAIIADSAIAAHKSWMEVEIIDTDQEPQPAPATPLDLWPGR